MKKNKDITDQEYIQKTTKALSKIFNAEEIENNLSDQDDLAQFVVMDPANVCLCYALTERAKLSLKPYTTRNKETSKIPKLNYDGVNSKGVYSTNYLSVIMKVCELDTKVELKVGYDYPLTISCEDFVFILAPRVGND
jgi:hypothetical protein